MLPGVGRSGLCYEMSPEAFECWAVMGGETVWLVVVRLSGRGGGVDRWEGVGEVVKRGGDEGGREVRK